MKKAQGGFTLIELMIVVAIIGILAAIAVPQYQQFQRKAKFSDVVSQTAAYKSAVELCIQNNNGSPTGCDTGTSSSDGTWSIPAAIASGAGKGNLDSLSIKDGTITAKAVSTGGLSGETYILIPTSGTASISWDSKTGSCRTSSPPIC